MKKFTRSLKSILAAAVLGMLLFGTLPARGQQVVRVTDITGGSSVFIFRTSSKAAPVTKRVAAPPAFLPKAARLVSPIRPAQRAADFVRG